ncbi:unnamed protein product [Angiostrongylus costaricensis]|uniref:G_PROTEIN_RECEP_F1_2 domain-containing protein n=1 Tax=Angiostrongylus costaricensis TaxID=334426 RepID=A0A158PGN7_ANGCS|nr:unnamed protein product [Angiostrongylus costaricensis]
MNDLLAYAIAELLLSIHISLSNLLILYVYIRKKYLRTVTNSYIFSLAVTDFLTGSLGIPITVISVLTQRPHSFHGCLLVHLILCILCTISTFHMLAIAFDKYVTICCHKQFFRSRRTRAIFLVTLSWIAGSVVAILPLFNAFGFAETEFAFHAFGDQCQFTIVVDYRYLVYVIFMCTIVAPTFLIIICYMRIYRRIRKEQNQVVSLLMKSEQDRRIQGRRKLIRTLLILVTSYGICWYPLYVINSIDYFWPEFSIAYATLWAVVLSHMSCALNPLIYAYGMPNFRKVSRIFSKDLNFDTNYQTQLESASNPSSNHRHHVLTL